MRILQLITQNQLRGAEVFAAQLSDHLAGRGHEVVLAAIEGGDHVLPTGPEVRQISLDSGHSGSAPIDPGAWRNLRRLLREFNPDVVQANGSETWKYAVLMRLMDPRRPVVYRNISVMSMWAGSGLKRRVVGAALRRMSHVASVTKVGEKDLIEGFGVRPERVSVLPIGVAVPPRSSGAERDLMRRSLRERFGLPPDCPLAIHVGSFTPEKNHRDLLQAFAQVVVDVPTARLLLVGDGPLRPEIEGAVAALSLGDKVVLAGTLPDAARVTAAADVLALPSLREGLPGVILEAGVAGVPVVAYDVGGVAEVVEDGVSGIVVPMGDVAGLAAGLTRLLRDDRLREALGAEARTRLTADFSLARVADGFERLYVSLMPPGSRGKRKPVRSAGEAATAVLRRSPLQLLASRKNRHSLAVLAYHSVDNRETFAQHMAFMTSHYRPVSLADVLEALEGRRELPPRAVLVTFDDGDQTIVRHALPVMRRQGAPGVLFVVAGSVGSTQALWWEEARSLAERGGRVQGWPPLATEAVVRRMKREPDQVRLAALESLRQAAAGEVAVAGRCLAADDLRLLDSQGIAVGNHTLTHPSLDRCDPEKVAAEIREAHFLLERVLGRPPVAFAYPGGYYSADARTVLEQLGYRAGFLFDHRLNRLPIADGLRISRLRVDAGASVDRLAIILSGLHSEVLRARGRV